MDDYSGFRFVSLLWRIRQKGLIGFWESLWQEQGDLAWVKFPNDNLVLLAVHPEHVKHVTITNREHYEKGKTYDSVRKLLLGNGLVTSNGNQWRNQRKLMNPIFNGPGLDKMYPIIADEGLQFAQRWERIVNQRKTVDMGDEMMLVTANIILKALFSLEHNENILALKNAIETMISFVATREMSLSLPLWVKVGKNREYWQARELVDQFINATIQQRRQMPPADWPDDILSRMMNARDEETGQGMSDQMLRDEAVTLFFAGHETTARTLTFFWYAVSQNPEVLSAISQELDKKVSGSAPTIDEAKSLTYTTQVVMETMRLYPAVPFYVRDCIVQDEMVGAKIPVGTSVFLAPYLTHRHPVFWNDPLHFDPNRWTVEQHSKLHPFAFHGFAAGQRACLGGNFSIFESQILIAILAKHFIPLLKSGFLPQFEIAGMLRASNGMQMMITNR
ncbi:MAG TPA: cytochrome P450 [Anaerolineales bacterium]|nr:cytochrome P450 [Anaerolineales bacterium]